MRIHDDLRDQQLLDVINSSQYDPHSTAGFYESFFLRANHPSKPIAFWIRYTVFCPRGHVDRSEGQLWGIYFDGERSFKAAAKQVFPMSRCSFSNSNLSVRVGDATLDGSSLRGTVIGNAHTLSWDLIYKGDHAPCFLLPLSLYDGGFPKAKALTGIPIADFSGKLNVDGHAIDVSGWRGSQNHNWGAKHTDMYAWGQVAGFDNNPSAFLECSTARLKIGPLWTPWFTNLVLRIDERDIKLNSLTQAIRNRGRYSYTSWSIKAKRGPIDVSVRIDAPVNKFVGLSYDDPSGGKKTCLNTKLASCKVQLDEAGKAPIILYTSSRAAFEILTKSEDHGVPISASYL